MKDRPFLICIVYQVCTLYGNISDLDPCTKLLYLSSMVLWRTSLYFFYLGDDEWMGSRMPSIEASNWEQISTCLPGMMNIGVFRHYVSWILSQCPIAPISLCVLLWTSYKRQYVVTSWVCVCFVSTVQNYASKQKKTNSNSLKLTVQ